MKLISEPEKWRPWGLLVVLLLGISLELALHGLYTPGEYRDDVSYIASSQAMAGGLGYTQIFRVDRVPETKYPPGYPLLLLPVQFLFAGSWSAMQALTGLTGLLALAVVWKLDRKLGPPTALLLAGNVFWVHSSTSIMSDVPFTALFLWWYLRLHRCLEGEKLEGKHRIELSLLSALLFYVRTVGVVAALVTVIALGKRFRAADGILVGCYTLLQVIPWLVFSRIGGYRSDFEDYAGLLPTLRDNGVYYSKVLGPLMWGDPFAAFFSTAPDGILWVAGCLAAALWTVGVWALIREGRFLAPACLAGFLFISLFWPFQSPRFLLPILPLLYLALLRGVAVVSRKNTVLAIFLTLLLAGECFVVFRSLPAGGRSQGPPSYQWLARNSSAQDVVSAEESGVWLYTGRRVRILYPVLARAWAEAWVEDLYDQSVDWVLFTPTDETAALLEICSTLPQHFVLRYTGQDGTRIFQVVGDRKAVLAARGWDSLAEEAFSGGDYALASQYLLKALRSQPWYVFPRVRLAQCQLALGNRDAARRIVDDVLRVRPGYPPAVYFRETLER